MLSASPPAAMARSHTACATTKHWGAIANHSGDADLESIYGADWPNTLDELQHRCPAIKAGRAALLRDTAAGRQPAEARMYALVRQGFLEAMTAYTSPAAPRCTRS